MFCIENPYKDNDEEVIAKMNGSIESQHIKMLNAQREAVLSSAKSNKFIAVSALARHEPPRTKDSNIMFGDTSKEESRSPRLNSPVELAASSASVASIFDTSSASVEFIQGQSPPLNDPVSADEIASAVDINSNSLTSPNAEGNFDRMNTSVEVNKVPAAKRENELYTGVSGTPAISATGDVWGRDDISDVIRLLQRQKRRQERRVEEEIHRKSGLRLLQTNTGAGQFFQGGSSGIRTSNGANQEVGVSRPHNEIFCNQQQAHHEHQQRAQIAHRILSSLPELKGVDKLRFVKMKHLTKIAAEHFAVDSVPVAAGSSPTQAQFEGGRENAENMTSDNSHTTPSGGKSQSLNKDLNRWQGHRLPLICSTNLLESNLERPSSSVGDYSLIADLGAMVPTSSKSSRVKSSRSVASSSKSVKVPSVKSGASVGPGNSPASKPNLSVSSKVEYDRLTEIERFHLRYHQQYHLDDEAGDYDEDGKLKEEDDGENEKTTEFDAEEHALFGDQEYLVDRQKQLGVLDLPERPIVAVSTKSNMKYVHVGNKGLSALSSVLVGDMQIRWLCLSNARVSCDGASTLAAALPYIKALTYLDLSQNAIADDGAVAIARAIAPMHVQTASIFVSGELKLRDPAHSEPLISHPLKQLILSGNRISSRGAKALINALLHSHVPHSTFRESLPQPQSPAVVAACELVPTVECFGMLHRVWLQKNRVEDEQIVILRTAVRAHNSGAVRRYEEDITRQLVAEAREREKERLRLLALANAEESSRAKAKPSLSHRIAATSARIVNVVSAAVTSINATREDISGRDKVGILQSWRAASPSNKTRGQSKDNSSNNISQRNRSSSGNVGEIGKVAFSLDDEIESDSEYFASVGRTSGPSTVDYGNIDERDVDSATVAKYNLKYVYF
jgi:hypothetical protein